MFNHCCIFIRNDIDYPLEYILSWLLFLWRWGLFDLFYLLCIFFLFGILYLNLFLLNRLNKCSNRICKGKANDQNSIAIEVIIRWDYFLHLISCCCIEIDIFWLKILKSIFRHHRNFISCIFHIRLQELNQRTSWYSIIICQNLLLWRKYRLSELSVFLFRFFFHLFLCLFLLLFLRLPFLLRILLNRLLFLHLFLYGLANIKHLNISFDFFIVNLVSIMKLKFQIIWSHLFFQLYWIHQSQ